MSLVLVLFLSFSSGFCLGMAVAYFISYREWAEAENNRGEIRCQKRKL